MKNHEFAELLCRFPECRCKHKEKFHFDVPCDDGPGFDHTECEICNGRPSAESLEVPFCPPHVDLIEKHPEDYQGRCILCELNELDETARDLLDEARRQICDLRQKRLLASALMKAAAKGEQ